MHNGWRELKLNQVSDVDNENLTTATDINFKFKYLDIASVDVGRINIPSNTILYSEAPSRARRVVRYGDILMSTVRPNLQGFCFFREKGANFIASTGFSVIRSKKDFCGKYIYHYLFSDALTKQIESLVSGSNYPALNSSQVKNLDFLTPPLPEQKKIAAILSSVDTVIEKTQAQIDKLNDLKTAMMQELLTKGVGDEHRNPHTEFKDSPVGRIPVGWECNTLSEVAVRICVGLASSTTHAYRTSGIPMIRNQNILPNELCSDDILYLSKEFSDANEGKKIKKGDILTVRTGYPGVSAVVPSNYDGCHSFTTLVTRVDTSVLQPEFFSILINSAYGKKFVLAGQAGGAQQNLNVSTLQKFPVLLPELSEQKKIIEIHNSLVSEIKKNTLKLEKNRDLKKALMQDLLTGKVRVKVDA